MARSTFRSWMKNKFSKGKLREMLQYGVDSGYSGLISYHETSKMYDKYEDEIWDQLYNDSQDFGHSNIMEFISTWRSADQMENDTTFKNYVVWYMAERVADELVGGDY